MSMRQTLIQKLTSRVHRTSTPTRKTDSAQATLTLITPIEHNTLTSLGRHIAASANGEVNTPL